ncbi:MAG: PD-(D/E)XK nuclease family protein, partial [Coleofasciculus sp. C2-GNP5-27]
STGESDLEILYEENDGDTLVLLVENKVNAGFQPKQYERYKQRGENYIKHGKANRCMTLLIAPRVYFNEDKKNFDRRIHYEEIKNWFENSRLPSGRKTYKISVLTSAIEKSTSGYQMVADGAVSQFWKDYWHLCMDAAPEFCMEEPKNKPAGSTFIYFGQTGLPREVVLAHKLTHGFFDLQFSGMGSNLLEMQQKYGTKLLDGMKIVKAAKSASIRIAVPKLSVADPLEDQKEKALKALHAGKLLLGWAHDNLR